MKFLNKKILLVFKFLFSISFFLFPTLTFAYALYFQHNSATLSTIGYDGGGGIPSVAQTLGTGLIGTINRITWYTNTANGYSSNIRILQCNNSNYVYNSCSVLNSTTVAGGDGTKHLFTLDLVSPITFNPSKYYMITVQGDGNSGSASNVYGSNSDSYPNGALYQINNANVAVTDVANGLDTTVADMYFSIENEDPPPVDLSGNYFSNLSPYTGSTTASTIISYSFDFYNTGYSYPDYGKVCIDFYNLEASPLQSAFQKTVCTDLILTGTQHVSGTTTLASGLTNAIFYQWDETTNSHAHSTTTDFIVVRSDLDFNGIPKYDATTTPTVVCTDYSWITESTKRLGCEITNGISQTIRFMFYPSQNTLNKFTNLKNNYANKPPFGYINSIINVFETATTTATSTTQIYISQFSYVSNFFTPIRTGLSVILFLMFGVYIFTRFKNFQP